jgi:hypothetical protein
VTAATVEVVRFEPSHRAGFSALHSDANDAAWCQQVTLTGWRLILTRLGVSWDAQARTQLGGCRSVARRSG